MSADERSARANGADLTIQRISLALGGTGEWTDAATMDAYVLTLAKERANEIVQLRAQVEHVESLLASAEKDLDGRLLDGVLHDAIPNRDPNRP
jgi:hypothetical protein